MPTPSQTRADILGPRQHRILACQHGENLLETHILGAELTNSLPKHTHDEYQISYSLTDPSNYAYRGEKRHIPTGVMSVLHPGEVHSSPDLCVRAHTSVFHVFYVPAGQMQQVAAQIAERPACLPHLPDPAVFDAAFAAMFLRLHHALSAGASRLEQDARLLGTLSYLISRCACSPVHAPAAPSTRALLRARDFLAAHCMDDVSLASLSQIAGLSEYHFCRAFGAVVGMPPHQYQTQARVHCAKRLIVAGVPLAQVATECGFTQQSHFGRQFKRITGITPGQYALDAKSLQAAIF